MTQTKVSAIPEGMHSISPHLICEGASRAIEYYKKAFGAIELMRMPAPDGKLMHAAIKIGDSIVMLVDDSPQHGMQGPKALKNSPVIIALYVEDADATMTTAVAAGGKATMPVTEMFWGDRYGQLEDPFGHRWSIATHVRDVTPEQMHEATKNMQGMG